MNSRQWWLLIYFNSAACMGHENFAFMAVCILADLALMMQLVFAYLIIVLLNTWKS